MIIGVVGQLDSGKGTVGQYLIDNHNFRPESFARPVKDCVSIIFGWPRHLLEGDTKESREFRERVDQAWSAKLGFDVTPRWALQRMGTEAGRHGLDDDIWIHSLDMRTRSNFNAPDFVITDTRFPNELDYIKSVGGFLIEVRRGNPKVWEQHASMSNFMLATMSDKPIEETYMAKYHPNIHISEWAHIGYKDIDFKIKNDGSLEDLYNNVENALNSFYGKE